MCGIKYSVLILISSLLGIALDVLFFPTAATVMLKIIMVLPLFSFVPQSFLCYCKGDDLWYTRNGSITRLGW